MPPKHACALSWVDGAKMISLILWLRASLRILIIVPVTLLAVLLLLALRSTPVAQSLQADETAPPFYLPVINNYRITYIHFPLVISPPPIVDSSPTTGAENQSVNLDLSWTVAPDGINQPYVYEVYLAANDPTPDRLLGRTDRTFYTPDTLELNMRYYWQVVAIDNQNGRYPGPVYTFTTESAAFPPAIGESIYVPAGEFLMGCDSSNPAEIPCYPEELPLHRVYLDGYYIDKYEVTNIEYRTCVAVGRCNAPRRNNSYTRSNYFNNPDYDYFPVLYVSWWDAQDYCSWAGKRLPTEAEWEKAARGMAGTRVWPWGNEPPNCSLLNFTDNSGDDWQTCVNDTIQVGTYPQGASPYGVHDMGGNVFEWVFDKYDVNYYSNSPYYNPQGNQLMPDLFTIRGGSYRPNWYYARVAHRHWGHRGDGSTPTNDAPYYRNNQVGFRCAYSP